MPRHPIREATCHPEIPYAGAGKCQECYTGRVKPAPDLVAFTIDLVGDQPFDTHTVSRLYREAIRRNGRAAHHAPSPSEFGRILRHSGEFQHAGRGLWRAINPKPTMDDIPEFQAVC